MSPYAPTIASAPVAKFVASSTVSSSAPSRMTASKWIRNARKENVFRVNQKVEMKTFLTVTAV
jgi:hypothetical protein